MAKAWDIQLVGDKALQARMRALPGRARKGIAAGLYEAAQQFMQWSAQFVPVDTGALRNSGHVEPPKEIGERVEVVIGYGGIAVEYALIVHEWDDPTVNWSVPGTGPFYLTRPLGQFSNRIPGMVADRVRAEFARGPA